MAWYADLSQCDYFGGARNILAVGWLEADHDFPAGDVSKEFMLRLEELLQHPWQRSGAACGGVKECPWCMAAILRADGTIPPEAKCAIGWANLFVPGEGVVYAAPQLILHYISAHRYRPPQVFVDAVMRCPQMRSAEYFRKLEASGLGTSAR